MADQQTEKLEGGAYEVIRNRLTQQGNHLLERLQKLDAARKEVFGAVEPQLLSTERIQTANNCIPRGMVALPDNRFIFGYNVHLGLKSQVDVGDVFAVFAWDPSERTFREQPLDFLSNEEFVTDFRYLYKYYRKTVFAKFMIIGPHLFMAFRTGDDVRDVKVFKWLIHDDHIEYLGNRFEHEYQFPEQHPFDWKRAHRDMHRSGTHPHISIEDRVFVETVGGDLTIKIEDNTDEGEGIYSEPVDNPDQTLDDAEIHYACVGSLVFLRIKPYQEKRSRYFIYNEKVHEVRRVDSIAHSCVLLPEDHGVIFADGYFLHNGEFKRFEEREEEMLFERVLKAPNGEDFLYVFYERRAGIYHLMPYNLIAQKVENPIEANGYAVFDDGVLTYFKAHDDPQRHHAMQIWQTPFASREIVAEGQSDAWLFKIGNSDIVRCMAECQAVYNLLQRDDAYQGLYLDIVRACTSITDGYFWISAPEAFSIGETVKTIQATGQAAIEEFEKVQHIRKATRSETEKWHSTARKLFTEIDGTHPEDVRGYVDRLARMRSLRGGVIGLRELRYVDLQQCDELEAAITERADKVARQTVDFLLRVEALDPYREATNVLRQQLASVSKAAEARDVLKQLDAAGEQLELLIETISNLKIDDATVTTRIIDSVSELFTDLNQLKAETRSRRSQLMRDEGAAQFNAQLKLLEQSVANYLDIADDPERCDEYLTKVMVQLEELEGTYAEFDAFIEILAEKRIALQNAFETKRATLQETRNRRATKLIQSADRILKGIANRVRSMTEIDEINGYFAADLMVDKVRDLVDQLKTLGEAIKGDDLLTQLKTLQGDAIRQLKDRKELFVDGQNVIRFGKHAFTVNTQPLELTTVLRNDDLFFHLSGTQFFERITDAELLATRDVWQMQCPSENEVVYRAEFLACLMLRALDKGDPMSINDYLVANEDTRLQTVRTFMAPRYAEAYTKGQHDLDAERILTALANIHKDVGLLRYSPDARACALVFWQSNAGEGGLAEHLRERIFSFGAMLKAYPRHRTQRTYIQELQNAIEAFCSRSQLFDANLAPPAAEYLFYEIVEDEHFYSTREAAEIADNFHRDLVARRFLDKLQNAMETVGDDAVSAFRILRDWLQGYAEEQEFNKEQREFLNEAAAHRLRGGVERRRIVDVPIAVNLNGLRGIHPTIGNEGSYRLHYLHFMDRLRAFEQGPSTRYRQFEKRRQQLLQETAASLRLDEFKPRVLSAFVRNKLLDSVYLPLIGDNLAKQLGTAGEGSRTDRMGLLLLVSPPGYGKTTLMEYVASRLGITFVKVNGPALGHEVTSLDPAQCANQAARQEVEKINLAFEMGDNVLIYLDDIQHTNPELLQKFISLCDGTRRIEGVYKGRSRTYDLRGRKVAVVMAGNPYTETGGKFQIPDMLANRADTYNLGDIIGESSDAFEASYVENALTSNPTLTRLSSCSRNDVYGIMQIARTGQREGVDFEASFSIEEVNEMVAVMKKLFRVRDTILRVNLEYVRSAAQADDYRTEPPFKLQGSYRNMNRIAEKVLPILTDSELERLIVDHYTGEAQTLTDGAEANLLKFRQLEGKLTEADDQRWKEICKRFNRNKLLGGSGDTDPVNRVVAQLADVGTGLTAIGEQLSEATKGNENNLGQLTQNLENLWNLNRQSLDAGTQQASASTAVLASAVHEIGNHLSTGPVAALREFPEIARETAHALRQIATSASSESRSEALEAILATLARAESEQSKAFERWIGNRADQPENPSTIEALPAASGALKLDARTEALLQSILIAFHHLFKHTGIDRDHVNHPDPQKS